MTIDDRTGPGSSAKPPTSKRTIAAVFAVTATVIAAAAIIVPWAMAANEATSSSDTLEVRDDSKTEPVVSSPFANALLIGEDHESVDFEPDTHWRVPVSAPLSTLPLEADMVNLRCSDAQFAWLGEHAVYIDSPLNKVTLRNSATGGGAISIENIRFAGEPVEGEAWVQFSCPAGGIGGGDDQPVLIPVDGSPAVWGAGHFADEDEWSVGSPVTINLEPGQAYVGNFVENGGIDVDQRGPVVGELADGSGTVVLIEDLRVDRPRIPGFALGWRWIGAEYVFACTIPDPAGGMDDWGRPLTIAEPCTPAEGEELLRAAADAAQSPSATG